MDTMKLARRMYDVYLGGSRAALQTLAGDDLAAAILAIVRATNTPWEDLSVDRRAMFYQVAAEFSGDEEE